ncbi:hypothetical protein [Slackia exigua]
MLAADMLQFGFAAVVAWEISLSLETPLLSTTEAEWECVLALGIVCSAIGSGI